ncbi:hypothetical protein C8A01DRAFT_15374 [Parachaetomium inaequale]|uniref:C3H1-type domain-containing protein n=1 Tax=Parachaetomium inaequale TaxID=2588326 RepID=A0AAN6PHM3_9PEZI|nr:hypothetical protein C8A01DRAFT_15374 [Parachaetomium inaequale]
MLNDQEIERAAAQLADYKRSDALSQLLDQYSVLIDDYKRLKSDYEEERESREKYKQMAKDQERNPFVLVLVDGDGYVFNEALLSKRADGGSVAAQLLNDEVKASLRRKGLEHCQVMVRIYANVFGLSKALSKTGVVGADSRSLAPFIASFNRSYGLTEFVDAGQLKENADFKLRAMLRLYADNSQCKHIYFAACHDVGYISELTPFMGNSSKFTLINTPGVRFHDEFTKLGMGIEEFRAVFRHSPLDGPAPYRPINGVVGTPAKPVLGPPQPASPTKPSLTLAASDDSKTVCLFHSIGKCKYGKSCKMLHGTTLAEPKSSQQYAGLPTPSSPGGRNDNIASLASQLSNLPKAHEIPDGCVAVNANNYRLDPYQPPISADVMSRLKARVDKRRVCNSFHLQGACDAGDRCEYDHEPLEPEVLPALLSLARSQPCPRRGGCRLEGCSHGHICQNPECKHRGGKAYCKLPYLSHLEPLGDARFPPSVPKGGRKTNGGSASSTASG